MKYLLLFAALMLTAKPFVGFSINLSAMSSHSVFIKSFTKRKLEYVKDGVFDTQSVHERLADPLSQILLFSFLLAILFPAVLNAGKLITNRLLANIRFALFPPAQLYLLCGTQLI